MNKIIGALAGAFLIAVVGAGMVAAQGFDNGFNAGRGAAAGGGGGVGTANGTAGRMLKFSSDAGVLGNSNIVNNATYVTNWPTDVPVAGECVKAVDDAGTLAYEACALAPVVNAYGTAGRLARFDSDAGTMANSSIVDNASYVTLWPTDVPVAGECIKAGDDAGTLIFSSCVSSTSIVSGTTPITGGGAAGVLYTDGSGEVAASTSLTFDGTALNAGSANTSNTVFNALGRMGIWQNTADANTPSMFMIKSRGSYASPATVQSGDYVLNIQGTPYVSTSTYMGTAGISARVSGSITGTSAPSELALWASDTDTPTPFGSGKERIIIDSTGNVRLPGLTASKGMFTDGSKNLTSTGTLGVDQGGTGLTSLTANRIPYGNGTSAFQNSANLTYDGNKFVLVGSAAVPLEVRGETSSYADTIFTLANGFAEDSPAHVTRHSRGTIASPSATQAGDRVALFIGQGYGGSGWGTVGGMRVYAEGTISGSTVPGNVQLWTTDSGGTETSRLEINSAGAVKINNLTASKLVFTDASKNLTSTGELPKGSCTLDGAATATCTATVTSGATCTCVDSQPSTNGVAAIACDVSSTTLTATSSVANDGSVIKFICSE